MEYKKIIKKIFGYFKIKKYICCVYTILIILFKKNLVYLRK